MAAAHAPPPPRSADPFPDCNNPDCPPCVEYRKIHYYRNGRIVKPHARILAFKRAVSAMENRPGRYSTFITGVIFFPHQLHEFFVLMFRRDREKAAQAVKSIIRDVRSDHELLGFDRLAGEALFEMYKLRDDKKARLMATQQSYQN
jgi:hypothetical protein